MWHYPVCDIGWISLSITRLVELNDSTARQRLRELLTREWGRFDDASSRYSREHERLVLDMKTVALLENQKPQQYIA